MTRVRSHSRRTAECRVITARVQSGFFSVSPAVLRAMLSSAFIASSSMSTPGFGAMAPAISSR